MVKRVYRDELPGQGEFKEIIESKSKEFNDSKGKVRTAMYASDYGSCQRKVWYQFFSDKFPPERITGKLARVFANGDDVHFRLSAYLADDRALEFEREIGVPRNHLEVHGRCDGMTLHKGQATIVEFKSINKKVVEAIKLEHEGQLMWYLGMWEAKRLELRKEFGIEENDIVVDVEFLIGHTRTGRDLSSAEKKLLRSNGPVKGEVIYECKPTQDVFSFPVAFDELKFKEVQEWYRQLKWYVEAGIRPRVRYLRTKFPCDWFTGKCQYYDICHGEGANQGDIVILGRKLEGPAVQFEDRGDGLTAEEVERLMKLKSNPDEIAQEMNEDVASDEEGDNE